MKSQITANGNALCKRCAMQSFIWVSKSYRPRVSQWVVYKEENGNQQCSVCGH